MKKEDKNLVIEALGAQLGEFTNFYLVNIEGLNAEQTSALRRACFKQDIKLLVAKNTLLQKALEKKGVEAEIFGALKGNTALMLANTGNAPAKLIKEFTKGDKTGEAKPQLKAAYVEETVYVGKQNLDFLCTIKRTNSSLNLLLCCNLLRRMSFLLSKADKILFTEFSKLSEREPNFAIPV